MNTTDAVSYYYNSEVMFEWKRLINHPIGGFWTPPIRKYMKPVSW